MPRFVGLLLLILSSCNGSRGNEEVFVKTNYSDKTTEIVDHTIYDLIGAEAFYEDILSYQNRTNEYLPDAKDTSAFNNYIRRYKATRKSLNRSVLLIAWPQIGLRESIINNWRSSDALGSTSDRAYGSKVGAPHLLLDSVDNQLIHLVLDSLRPAWLNPVEMKNASRFTLLAPTLGQSDNPLNSKSFTRWMINQGQKTEVIQFAVSRAMLNDAGTRACLLHVHLEPYEGSFGEFVFFERQGNRWELTKRLTVWQS